MDESTKSEDGGCAVSEECKLLVVEQDFEVGNAATSSTITTLLATEIYSHVNLNIQAIIYKFQNLLRTK